MQTQTGKDFWERVDKLNPFTSIKKLAIVANIDYNTIKKQRSELRFPKVGTIILISKVLNCSVDYLVTGKLEIKKNYPTQIEKIADKLCIVSEEDLTLIKRNVELLPSNNTLLKK
ncbi:MAG: hypothetical protein JJE21_08410 [Spirochaetaceae bacterium]|nr:hypothetical protein [Spirochaetaceae bacterium]